MATLPIFVPPHNISETQNESEKERKKEKNLSHDKIFTYLSTNLSLNSKIIISTKKLTFVFRITEAHHVFLIPITETMQT